MPHSFTIRLVYSILAGLLLCGSYGCDPSVNAKLDIAEQLVMNMPDSALSILQEVKDNYPKMEDKEKALYGVLLFQALDAKGKPLSPEEYIDFSIDYYNKENQKKLLAYSYLYKACMYRFYQKHTLATQHLFNATNLLKQAEDDYLSGRIYFELGHLSSIHNEMEKALEYLTKSIDHFEKAKQSKSIVKAYLMRGWIQMAISDFDASIQNARDAMQITKDLTLTGDFLNDIGNSYHFKDQPDSAVYYMKESLNYPYDGTNGAMRLYNLANAYSYIEEFDSAYVYVGRALNKPISIYTREECFRVLVRIAKAKGDKENVARYMEERRFCSDSIRSIESQPIVSLIEKSHISNIETKKIKYTQVYLIAAISILVLIVCLLVWWSIWRSKQKQRKADKYKDELERQEILVSDLSVELEKKQEILLSELAEELERTCSKYTEKRKKSSFEEREQIDKMIYNEVLHMDDENTFIGKMNNILNNLPEKLKIDYPQITYKDIMWCCLFMLNLSTTDIALLMDYTQSSQYKFKQRLSKKLNLKNVKELEQMLHEKVNLSA